MTIAVFIKDRKMATRAKKPAKKKVKAKTRTGKKPAKKKVAAK